MAEAGYSGTPQARKLGIKPGLRVAIEHAPRGWRITDPPDGMVKVTGGGDADVILCFCRRAAEVSQRLPGLGPRIHPDGAIWVAWPRRAGGHDSDITDNVVREQALPLGLVDVKVAAIDEDWSGLRVVWRKERR
jgi:hypothetical protein